MNVAQNFCWLFCLIFIDSFHRISAYLQSIYDFRDDADSGFSSKCNSMNKTNVDSMMVHPLEPNKGKNNKEGIIL